MAHLKPTILIFGVNSFVGSNLAEFFKNDYRVVGTYKRNRAHVHGMLTLPCDVLAKDEVQMVVGTVKPDYVIYAAGLSSLSDCAELPDFADALNTVGVFNVSENCQRYKALFCHLTSAFVFGGDKKEYLETDIPDSNSVYGKTNASAEFFIQKNNLNYLIFRCAKFYGRSFHARHLSWFEKLQYKLSQNEGIAADSYIRTGYIDIYYLAMLIKLCFEKRTANRLFHVSSKDIMTHYDFAKLYAEQFRESLDLISRTRWPFPAQDSAVRVYRGEELNYKLNVLNIEGYLNTELPTVEESLKFTYKRLGGVDRSNKKSNKGDSVSFI